MEYLPWIGFHILILAAMVVDLGLFHRKNREMGFREAVVWSGIWVGLALLFNLGVYFARGKAPALEFLAGYLVEWSLSVDNLFVFLTVFSAFAVPQRYQHRVLFWGILGALFMRAAFIFLGIAVLERFHWVMYVFGGFLVFTAVKLLFKQEEEADPRNHFLVKFTRRWLPFCDQAHDGRFFVKIDGRWLATPLFLVLLVVEFTDLIFAADSIPAILSITQDPFIVYTSNVFAILGLRSLYFALSGMVSLFHYLRFGLAGILAFVGLKLLLSSMIKVPIGVSLGVIGFFLAASVVASLLFPPAEEKKPSL